MWRAFHDQIGSPSAINVHKESDTLLGARAYTGEAFAPAVGPSRNEAAAVAR